ncbi:hypothetical protein MNBD_ALPHA11-2460 [hydrothermal vent metagenome]|uniref:Uncharacterized protein n=1 Tax=hydrothermal vent metagenome TaxID=652676 RepID=A0A3B0U4S8_9ZZZZ
MLHHSAGSITRQSKPGGPAQKACRGDPKSLFQLWLKHIRKLRENAKTKNKIRRKKTL